MSTGSPARAESSKIASLSTADIRERFKTEISIDEFLHGFQSYIQVRLEFVTATCDLYFFNSASVKYTERETLLILLIKSLFGYKQTNFLVS